MLSVIVPIFNREKYLRRCLDSIITQTYTKIELILVDDGSTNVCGKICDEYATSDNRVKVIHQNNQGVVAARRNGFYAATGDYIAFVDSDDWIAPDMYASLMKEVIRTDADRVFCDFYEVFETETQENKIEYDADPQKMLALILAYHAPWVIWNGLFKREVVRQTFEICIGNAAPAEDYLFSVVSLCLRPKLAAVKKTLYYYNRSSEGFVNKSNDILYNSRINIDAAYQFLVAKGIAKDYLNDMFMTPIRIKIGLLNKGDIDEAINLYPYSNRIWEFYSFLPYYIRWVYWGVFNWGIIGKELYILYIKIKRNTK